MGDFRNLIAWQVSDAQATSLASVFTVRRPNAYPGLRDQILRAAGSVADCLAEGCAKRSTPDLKRYSEMAYASAKEVQSQLERARKTRMITQEEYAELAPRADRVAALCFRLSGL